jgi:predicted O-linked N-acetylglucosamine transferase (SPINDLY family)
LVKKQVFTDPSRDQIDALINLYYSGQAIQVIHTCKKLLKIHKKSLVLLNLLGASSQAIGKYEEAINSYNRAIRVSPNDSGLRYNIALAFQNIGRPDSAIKNYNKAIQIKPDYAEAYNNLGSVLAEMMQPNEAIKNYNKAIQIQPDYAEAYNNLGNILKDLVKPNEAIKNYNKAIQLKPDYAEAYNDLGVALQELGRLDEAIKNYKKAIQLKPDYAEAYSNIGVALQELGRLDEAIKNYKKAIQLKPDYAEAYSNFGTALQELGRSNEAIKSHNKAIQLDPNDSSAYSNLGVALKDLGQLDEAINNYNKAIKLKPDYEIAYNNLGVTLRELGRLDEAVKNYSKAIQLKPSYTEAYSNLLMDLNYATSTTPTQAITTARKFGEFVTENTQMRFSNYQNLSASKKLRVGFVSGDLRRHPVGYFLENVLSHINPDRIELVAYSASSIIDDLSKRITPLFSTWKSIYGQNNEVVAKTIHSDKIHILIDLSGHTAYNRLPVFGWRPAPIQVSWLGYFATTGLNEMDYLLGDPYVTPAEYDSHFTEKVWRLTKTRWCFTPPNVNINVAELPALNNGYITFGCFNNLSKMNHKVVELWSKVLKSTPNSRLLLKAKQLRDKSTQENVIQKFGIQGIKSERIILEGPEKREKYFSAYNRIDIALDPFPFTGGTTSVECLWMGVPVLTLAGDSLISRQGVGILMNIGLPNWIAENESEYITKSIFFASDLEKLVELRAGLRMQALTSPLFDAQNFAQDFENALWGMWEKYLHQSQIK